MPYYGGGALSSKTSVNTILLERGIWGRDKIVAIVRSVRNWHVSSWCRCLLHGNSSNVRVVAISHTKSVTTQNIVAGVIHSGAIRC